MRRIRLARLATLAYEDLVAIYALIVLLPLWGYEVLTQTQLPGWSTWAVIAGFLLLSLIYSIQRRQRRISQTR